MCLFVWTLLCCRNFQFCHINPLSVSTCLRSYRFMDMFPDTASIREIQRELDDIIQQGVRNITRLIRASDTTVTDPLQAQSNRHSQTGRGTGSTNFLTGSRGQRGQKASGQMMDSSLASRLVRDGLLTPDLLQQLQREWSKDQKQDNSSQRALDVEHQSNNKGKRKKKKKWRTFSFCFSEEQKTDNSICWCFKHLRQMWELLLALKVSQ